MTDRALNILLVDDEPLVRRSVRRALRGHQVVEASTGLEALELLAQERFDGILCDLLMPGMGGIEFWRELNSRDPAQCRRLVIMSGSPRSGQRLLPEWVRVLEKPLEPGVLQDVVEGWHSST